MTGGPEVSVVMSVYNGAEGLVETLESILQQEGCDFEFIVVDDGSTDNSSQLLDEHAARDSRLRVFHQANRGLTAALSTGCAAARGEFIARQDAGDRSLPGRLQAQAAALLVDPKLAFVSCVTRCVGPKGEYLMSWHGTGRARTPTPILDIEAEHGVVDGPSCHPSVMFRRACYERAGGYRPEFYFGQDWDLWYRLAALGLFQMLDDVLYEARVGVADISTSNKSSQEALARLSERAMRLRLHDESDAQLLEEASRIRPGTGRKQTRAWRVSRGCYFIGECLRRNGDAVTARSYLWQALQADPGNLRAAVRLAQTLLFRPANVAIRGRGK